MVEEIDDAKDNSYYSKALRSWTIVHAAISNNKCSKYNEKNKTSDGDYFHIVYNQKYEKKLRGT